MTLRTEFTVKKGALTNKEALREFLLDPVNKYQLITEALHWAKTPEPNYWYDIYTGYQKLDAAHRRYLIAALIQG